MEQRITLKKLQKFDLEFDESYVRLIEMEVDSIVYKIDPVYSLQFWTDVSLYGLREARTYLKNFLDSSDVNVSLDKLDSLISSVERAFKKKGW